MGHRIAKHVGTTNTANTNPATNFILESSTYYVLDASGNTMSVYERTVNGIAASIKYEQAEKHIYGSSRLGVMNVAVNLLGTAGTAAYSQTNWTHRIGQRTYELTNHLGNVLSVISDKVIPHVTGSTVAYYKADILQAQDYSPFGVTLKNRGGKKTVLSDKFRFGFNGMEADDEMKGEGNSYTTEFRMLDSRLGRWLSLDPMYVKFLWQSPYVAFDNKPIVIIDPNGLEGENPNKEKQVEGVEVKDNISWSISYENLPILPNLEEEIKEKVYKYEITNKNYQDKNIGQYAANSNPGVIGSVHFTSYISPSIYENILSVSANVNYTNTLGDQVYFTSKAYLYDAEGKLISSQALNTNLDYSNGKTYFLPTGWTGKAEFKLIDADNVKAHNYKVEVLTSGIVVSSSGNANLTLPLTFFLVVNYGENDFDITLQKK